MAKSSYGQIPKMESGTSLEPKLEDELQHPTVDMDVFATSTACCFIEIAQTMHEVSW